jgi:hypothetical protein
MALAILHPFTAPRLCACGDSIDPAGFHSIYCKHDNFSGQHARVVTALLMSDAPRASGDSQQTLTHAAENLYLSR